MNDNFESMEDLLMHALNHSRINYYAFALGRSRKEMPTDATARLTMQLIYTQGPKWIELLERFAISNYELMFEVFRDCPMVFPTLVAVAHPVANVPMLQELQAKIFDILESNPTDLVWCAFVEVLRYHSNGQNSEQKIRLLNRISETFDRNPRFLEAVDLIQDSKTEEAISSIYSLTSYKVLLGVVRLYKECCKIFRKKMTYLQAVAKNGKLVEWMRGKYASIFNNFQEEIAQRQNLQSHFKQDLLECLRELKDFVEIEPFAVAASDRIVALVFAWSVLPSRHEDPEQQLNWEYGLIFEQYGDDLPSNVALTTTTLSAAVPAFLRGYLTCLSQADLLASETLMRLSITYKAINARRDLITQLLDPIVGRIIENLEPYSLGLDVQAQANFCRKLRLFLLFSGVLKEVFFSRLIELTLEMVRKEDYTSFCFVEGYNILHEIKESSNRGKNYLERTAILTREKIPDIVNGLLNVVFEVYQKYPLSMQSEQREGKLYKVLTLLQQFLSSNESLVEKLAPDILKHLCEWATEEATFNWSRGITTTSVLALLIKTCKLTITLMKEDYYCDLERPIYSLLELLKHHQSRDFEEELVEILTFVINMEGKISPSACTVLTSLQRLVDNSKSLYCIISVLKALSCSRVAASVLYEWPDLCLYFLNLFGNYINMVTAKYREFYPSQFEEIIVVLGRFLQVYQPYFDDNEEARKSILFILHRMNKDELQLQLFIVMDHHRPVDPYRFFTPSVIPTLTRRNTFRMLYIHYCDRLLRNYSETLMNELIQLYKVDLEKRSKRAFVSEVNADWPCLQTATKDYLTQMLQELKRKGMIDAMEHSMYLRDLDLQY